MTSVRGRLRPRHIRQVAKWCSGSTPGACRLGTWHVCRVVYRAFHDSSDRTSDIPAPDVQHQRPITVGWRHGNLPRSKRGQVTGHSTRQTFRGWAVSRGRTAGHGAWCAAGGFDLWPSARSKTHETPMWQVQEFQPMPVITSLGWQRRGISDRSRVSDSQGASLC